MSIDLLRQYQRVGGEPSTADMFVCLVVWRSTYVALVVYRSVMTTDDLFASCGAMASSPSVTRRCGISLKRAAKAAGWFSLWGEPPIQGMLSGGRHSANRHR